jgi:hypothetical protein
VAFKTTIFFKKKTDLFNTLTGENYQIANVMVIRWSLVPDPKSRVPYPDMTRSFISIILRILDLDTTLA